MPPNDRALHGDCKRSVGFLSTNCFRLTQPVKPNKNRPKDQTSETVLTVVLTFPEVSAMVSFYLRGFAAVCADLHPIGTIYKVA